MWVSWRVEVAMRGMSAERRKKLLRLLRRFRCGGRDCADRGSYRPVFDDIGEHLRQRNRS